jgi:ribonuclease VapC
MIVDSSALLAIAFQEPGFEIVLAKMSAAPTVIIGTPTLAEIGLVLHARLGADADGMLERMIDEFEIVESAFTDAHWREAVEAFRRFGKGRHPAHLNFGHCLTYAAASIAEQPLLCVGEDFQKTDLPLVP